MASNDDDVSSGVVTGADITALLGRVQAGDRDAAGVADRFREAALRIGESLLTGIKIDRGDRKSVV